MHVVVVGVPVGGVALLHVHQHRLQHAGWDLEEGIVLSVSSIYLVRIVKCGTKFQKYIYFSSSPPILRLSGELCEEFRNS